MLEENSKAIKRFECGWYIKMFLINYLVRFANLECVDCVNA
jgi:hypothetical protein